MYMLVQLLNILLMATMFFLFSQALSH